MVGTEVHPNGGADLEIQVTCWGRGRDNASGLSTSLPHSVSVRASLSCLLWDGFCGTLQGLRMPDERSCVT